MTMASVGNSTRLRRKTHVGLYTQQRRLRNLQNICACNIQTGCDDNTGLVFTLHINEVSTAFYTSEKCTDTINPKWRNFDESKYPEKMNTAIPETVVRIWCEHDNGSHTIVEWTVNFSGLQCVGEQIFKNDKKYKYNTIFFGMFECYYTARDCLQFLGSEKLENCMRVDSQLLRSSYGVSSLQRIHTIQRAIKQTQVSIWKIRELINDRLLDAQRNEHKQAEKEQVQMLITSLRYELQIQKMKLESQGEQKSRMIGILHDHEFKLMNQRDALKAEKMKLNEKRKILDQERERLVKANAELALRRKCLISETPLVYPIQEVANKGFCIRNVHLPNSEDFNGCDDTMISVALGFVTQLVSIIARFLDIPLRYPVRFLSSRSKIMDYVVDKLPDKDREFPLYAKGKDKLPFNYAVFLLNKNIAQLRYANGLLTKDLRTTLCNLQGLVNIQLGYHLEQQSSSFHSLSDTRSVLSSNSTLEPRTKHLSRSPIHNIGSPFLIPGTPSSGSIHDRESPHLRAGYSSNSTVPNGTVLSYSLDKGLDELVTSSAPGNPLRSSRSPCLRRAVAFHGGSEPNLARHHTMQLIRVQTDGSPSSVEEIRTFPDGMVSWGAGSSRANSDEEMNNLQNGFAL